MKTWKVIDWKSRPPEMEVSDYYPLTCEKCEREAFCPSIGNGIIIEGGIGMGLINDPKTPTPKWFMPDEIQCRYCKTHYSDWGKNSVGKTIRKHV